MFRPIRRRLISLGIVIAVATSLAACGTVSSPHGELARNKEILSTCDRAKPPASLVELDVSGSSLSDAIVKERMTALTSIVRRTAICSGYLRVSLFSVSSANTAALFDGPLHLEGATDSARLKRVPRVVDETMTNIRRAYGPTVKSMPTKGSDVTSVYRLGAEWITQLGSGFRLHLYVFTDGFQTVGVQLGRRALSKQEAIALADKTTIPKLPGAAVTVAGLGRVAGSPPPSEVVEGLVAYYTALCRKADAATCVSVTDYEAAGQ